MNHAFNIEIAEKFGIHEAILIENIAFWIKKNVSNGSNKHDGLTWVYNSAKAFNELFPYMTKSKINTALRKLEKLEVLKTGVYNKAKYDRTKWYTIISDEVNTIYKIELVLKDNDDAICSKSEMDSDENGNANGLNEQPIPVINSFINSFIDPPHPC